MKLIPNDIKIPKLYEQDGKGDEAIAHVKLFTPDSNWTWFVTEWDGEDRCFGLVKGFETELGYFSLSELKAVRGPMGLPIERDKFWKPKTLREIKKG